MRRFLTRTKGGCAVASAVPLSSATVSASLKPISDTSGCISTMHSSFSLTMATRHVSSVFVDPQSLKPSTLNASEMRAEEGTQANQGGSNEQPISNSPYVDRPARGTAALLAIPLDKVGTANIEPSVFITYVRSYLRSEHAIAERVGSSNIQTQRLTHALRSQHQTLTRLHRAAVFRRVQDIIANRQVSLRVATRLLNTPWPHQTILEGYQQSIMNEVHAWIVEVVNANLTTSDQEDESTGSLSSQEARVVLQNCTLLLRSSPKLVGPLATIAMRDVDTVKSPEVLIQLMWAVSRSGAHAPDSFWRCLVARLAKLNKDQHGSIADVLKEGTKDGAGASNRRSAAPVLTHAGELQGEERVFNGFSEFDRDTDDVEGDGIKYNEADNFNDNDDGGGEIGGGEEDDVDEESAIRSVPSSDASPSLTTTGTSAQRGSTGAKTSSNSHPAGHVFSGMTTRQIFRMLRVLKRERWCGDVAALNLLADQALKNIVFETDAAMFSLMKGETLSRRGVSRRIRRAADLDISDFFSFLCITGDLGIRFSGNAMKVSDLLISPTVRHLSREDLTILLEAIDCTQCHSPVLMQAVIDVIPTKGSPRGNPLAMLHSTHALRIIVHKPTLATQLKLHDFLQYYFEVCDLYRKKQSGSQLVAEIDLLYILSRRYASDSAIGKTIRRIVDESCFQLERMLQRDMISLRLVTHALETTIVLGMRNRPEYPHVMKLLSSRNAFLDIRQNGITADVKLLRVLHDDGAKDAVSTTTHDEEQREADEYLRLRTPDEETPDLKRLFDAEHDYKPRIPKAVYDVYSELLFTYQHILMQRRTLKGLERSRIARLSENVGVFNFLRGALIMKQVHLRMNEKDVYMPTTDFPYMIPSSVENVVTTNMLRRLRAAAISEKSEDEEVLRLLGQRTFDDERARHLVIAARSSPLTVLRTHPRLWNFIKEVARRFGSEETQSMAKEAEGKLSN